MKLLNKPQTITIVILVAIILTILFRCGKCVGPRPPSHKDDKAQVDSIKRSFNDAQKRLSDSIESLNAALNIKQDQELVLMNDRDMLLTEITKLKNKSKPKIDSFKLSWLKADTSKETLENCQELLTNFDNYIAITTMEIKNCDSLLQNKSAQADILKEHNQILAKATNAARDAVNALSGKYDELYADYKKYSKPRNQIYAGLDFMGGLDKPFYIGVSGGLKTKGNKFYSVGALIGNDQLRAGNPSVIDNLYFRAGIQFLMSFRKK